MISRIEDLVRHIEILEVCNRIKKVTLEEVEFLSKIPLFILPGFCAKMFDLANVPRVNPIPPEYFNAFMDAVVGGVEPEFETEEEYLKYKQEISELMSLEWIVSEKRSPYKDKTIPFLGKPIKEDEFWAI